MKRVGKLPLPLQGDSVKLRNRAFSQLGAALAVCSLAAACTQQGTPDPTPAPPPTSSSPAETQLERQTRLDFQAAEKAYRLFRAEYTRVATAGGSDRPTAAMRQNAAGPYLAVMTDFLAQTKASGKRQQGVVRIAYVRPESHSPKEVTLQVCEDGTQVKNVTENGRVSTGIAAKIVLYVRPVDGRWKVWNGDDEEVSSCTV